MAVITKRFNLSTNGDCDIIDITDRIKTILSSLKVKDGIVNVSIAGSTAAVATCEYEPGLVKDLKIFFNKYIPKNHNYNHDAAWGDGNGHAHISSSLVGPSKSFSFSGKKINLGTWQQIILIDFDNRSRKREVIVQVVGE